MCTLRITQVSGDSGGHQVELSLEDHGLVRQTATVHFRFEMTAQESEDLRWYLEDFLEYPHDPAPKIAKRIEEWIDERGVTLFEDVFRGSEDARSLWAAVGGDLSKTRVEIITTVEDATSIPWEIIRNAEADVPLATQAGAFVRTHTKATKRPLLPQVDPGPIRILLAICRPRAASDVPFRSVASRLIKGLDDDVRKLFQLDVLRPPTYERLGRVLRAAKADGRPYHAVHFDGHGIYEDLHAKYLTQPSAKKRGYLVFEDPGTQERQQYIHGTLLGSLLAETGVPLLVLNACRSAHSEAPAKPGQSPPNHETPAFGSLAQEAHDAGVTGVVAMRYNVYVVTAAQFVADLYANLAHGCSLGEAVTLGRRQLAADPQREIAFEPRPLQDWLVPVVYEAAPTTLLGKKDVDTQPTVTFHAGRNAAPCGTLDANLPPQPAVGFIGRDETLLAMDRAFDTQHVVLLHAYAGEGKTAAAAEFARWYTLTGGIEGPVLFTSFERHRPLARVLDRVEQVFGRLLEQSGVNWLTLDDAQRRDVTLRMLGQHPVLWVWDNVEPVAGFPSGAESAWSAAEQQELVDFLRDARQTKAKFLLTSRRDERGWLSELPHRIKMPPMPMQERIQFARAFAHTHGGQVINIGDWWPLLEFTQGNPLTITAVVGQALRDGLTKREQITAFIDQLRAGQAKFVDEVDEERSTSLGASLSHGFEHAFNADERRTLALLHLCQGFVEADVLRFMTDPKGNWCLPDVRGLTRDGATALLERAAEVGLLSALGHGFYTVHPVVPSFLKALFEAHYPSALRIQTSDGGPLLAFVEVMRSLGLFYRKHYESGSQDISVTVLRYEEANLLFARSLARAYGWWHCITGIMAGLSVLYEHTGRKAEWRRLLEETVAEFVDPVTDGPLPGRDEKWSLVTQWRVQLARDEGRLAQAESLQRLCVDSDRRLAVSALAAPAGALDDNQRQAIQRLASSVHDLATIQHRSGMDDFIATYKEAFGLFRRADDRAGAVKCAFNLGGAHINVVKPFDFREAQGWIMRALELVDVHDMQTQSEGNLMLGLITSRQFEETLKSRRPREELLHDAARYFHKALESMSRTAVHLQGAAHSHLGSVHMYLVEFDRALLHYQEAIRYFQKASDEYGAGDCRFRIAYMFEYQQRFADAREYALEALRNFKCYGGCAQGEVNRTERLIARIEQHLR